MLEGAPLAHMSDQRDVSRADFTWCMVAADWGFGVEEVAARLMEESSKARENGEQYALTTAQRAAQAAQGGANANDRPEGEQPLDFLTLHVQGPILCGAGLIAAGYDESRTIRGFRYGHDARFE